MGLDPTCRLCDPFNDAENAGCGGIGPNHVEIWTINGSLSMKEAGFDSKLVGLSGSDISFANTVGVLGAIVIRLMIGPLSDQIGLRLSCSALLLMAAVPGFCLCGKAIAIHRSCAVLMPLTDTNAEQLYHPAARRPSMLPASSHPYVAARLSRPCSGRPRSSLPGVKLSSHESCLCHPSTYRAIKCSADPHMARAF